VFHTRADGGFENQASALYVDRLKNAGITVGIDASSRVHDYVAAPHRVCEPRSLHEISFDKLCLDISFTNLRGQNGSIA
jgi:hypothetical protein